LNSGGTYLRIIIYDRTDLEWLREVDSLALVEPTDVNGERIFSSI